MPDSVVAGASAPAVVTPPLIVFFSASKRHAGHVYHHREENIWKEGRKHAALAEILFHRGRPPQACLRALVELANDQNYPLRHSGAGNIVHRVETES